MTDADYLKIIYLMPSSQTDIPPIERTSVQQANESLALQPVSNQSQSIIRGSVPLDDASVNPSRNSFS